MAAPARAVHRLTDQQRRTAHIGAAVAAGGFVAVWAPEYPEGHAFGFTAIGLVTAGLLFFAARRGSVVLTALAAFLVSFGPWSFYWVLGLPYLVWSGLLLYQASKAAAANPRPPRQRKAKAKAEAEPAPAPAPAERRPPGENKRYTPPAARKKRR